MLTPRFRERIEKLLRQHTSHIGGWNLPDTREELWDSLDEALDLLNEVLEDERRNQGRED